MASRMFARGLMAAPRSTSALQCRLMSTSTSSAKYDFLVIAPDKAGARQRRLECRPAHFDGLTSRVQTGQIAVAGAILRDIPKSDDVSDLDFEGSAFIVRNQTREEVWEMLRSDHYAKNDVWDLEKTRIIPFKKGVGGYAEPSKPS